MSKYIFYMLCCKNKDIKDFYIGSSSNMRLRKIQHKFHTTNPNSLKRHQLKYKTIINNGGYENWEYIELGNLECSKQDAFHHENILIRMFQPSLNQRNATKN